MGLLVWARAEMHRHRTVSLQTTWVGSADSRYRSSGTQDLARCQFPKPVEVRVEVAAPELADATPHGRRVAWAVDAVEDAGDGAAGELVFVLVLLDERADVRADRRLLVTRLFLVLQHTITHHSKFITLSVLVA